jgi:DNA polymerase III epsilon subunit-like protein
LIELYHYYFPNQEFKSHDALEDVKACARCYFKLKKNIDIMDLPKRNRLMEDYWEEWESNKGELYYYNSKSKITQLECP